MLKREMRTGFPFLDDAGVLAFAHRGAHETTGENTAGAFEEAVALGYRYIETDVQASRDGVAVISHDETLERTMGRPGRIEDLRWAELAGLRNERGEGLVRLDDALTAFPRTRFNLDAKRDASVTPIGDAIARCDAVDRVCVGSFDVRRTLRLRAMLGDRLCWSPSRRGVLALWLSAWRAPVPRLDFPVVQVPTHHRGVPVVTPRFVASAHARCVQVHVWTVDEEREMERLLDLGVDGLMTDRPRLLKRVLERRGLWRG